MSWSEAEQGLRIDQEEEEGSGLLRSSVNETNDLCTKNENSLTYDNCAMKPMNNNGKPRNETRAWKWNVGVWFNIKSAWMDLQRKCLCCSLHGNGKNCVSFWWLVMDCTPIPNRDGSEL